MSKAWIQYPRSPSRESNARDFRHRNPTHAIACVPICNSISYGSAIRICLSCVIHSSPTASALNRRPSLFGGACWMRTIDLEGNLMSLESMLSALSPNEKLAAMNILWKDLSSNPAGFISPDWHGDVLAGRIANPSDQPRLPIDAAFEEIKERLNARRTQG